MTEIRFKARLMFQPPWEATSINGGPLKHRARLAIDPETTWGKESLKLIRDTRKAVAKEKWKNKAEGILETIRGDKNKESWFESDYRNAEGDVQEGFEGLYHLSALSDAMPLMLDADRTEISKRDRRMYSGCYVVAKVDIYAQDNEHGKGMRAGLMGLQFWKDGDAFGSSGKIAKVEDFEDLSDTGEDDDEKPAKPSSSARRPPVEDDDDDIA